jgi:hypothetical protein
MSPKEDLTGLQKHLKEVTEGPAFRGSHRSARFLTYVVEHAISGNSDSLKERAIGIELFGRSPEYDTGADAVVRVTASDVRRRLLQHYSVSGPGSSFRISLPPGSYVPEIKREAAKPAAVLPGAAARLVSSDGEPIPDPQRRVGRGLLFWLTIALCILGSNIAVWFLAGKLNSPAASAPAQVLPWSAIFRNRRATTLVTSDPNIGEIMAFTKSIVSASDYANQNYVPKDAVLSPDVTHFIHDILRGDKAANVDTPIVASVAQLAQENGSAINVRPARELDFASLDTDQNFVFLGSPRTDPWTTLFDDQLDFQFHYDNATHQELIENLHPRAGEPSQYVPTAKGFATGESFATISFVRNPDHAGQVLLLAGANAEGTKAAGELVTDLPRLSAALDHCGIRSSEPVQHFQLLLRLSMMAGSPRTFEVLSCHPLQ